MERRELLKGLAPFAALPLTPLFIKGQEVGKTIEVEKDKYIVLWNTAENLDVLDEFIKTAPLPANTPVYVVRDIENAVKIFKL